MRSSQLAERLLSTRPALFLGAGACISSGGTTASELARTLQDKFHLRGQVSDDLAEVSSVVEKRFSRRDLVDAIIGELKPLRPDGALLALARVDWRAIFSTNYDQLMERAYKDVGKNILVVRSNHDFSANHDPDSSPFFKIHGCISQDTSYGHRSGMVLTFRDYDTAANFRETLFERLQLELSSGPVVFVGYSIQDRNVQDVLVEAIRRQRSAGAQGEIFAVFRDINEDRAAIWLDRGLRGVCCADINELANEFANRADPGTSIVLDDETELRLPPSLEASTINIMTSRQKPNPRGIFYGAPATYEDIRRGYTFARDIERGFQAADGLIFCLLGAAGTGKSTLARRLLFLHFSNTTNVYEHRTEIPFIALPWIAFEKQLREAGQSAILLLDNCAQHLSQINRLVAYLPTDNSSLRLILTAETSIWRVRQKHPRLFSDSETVVLSKLSKTELTDLLKLVTSKPELSQHAEAAFLRKAHHAQLRQLQRRCSADMFVCLKALFSSDSLDDIILNEFASLDQPFQEIYRLTCALEAAGSVPHRQMILRLSGLSLDLISASLDVLEGLISEAERTISPGIFLWKSRHEIIARIISTYKYSDPDELYRLLNSAIATANPTYHEEVKMLRDMCNSDRGIRAIPDDERRIELYQLIADTLPSDNVVRHRLVHELLFTRKLGDADAEIARAIDDVGLDLPLQRYKTKVLLGRAQNTALQPVDRRAIIDAAIPRPRRGLKRFPDNKYMYFVLADAAEDWYFETGEHGRLEWARHLLQTAFNDLLDPDVLDRINRMPT